MHLRQLPYDSTPPPVPRRPDTNRTELAEIACWVVVMVCIIIGMAS